MWCQGGKMEKLQQLLNLTLKVSFIRMLKCAQNAQLTFMSVTITRAVLNQVDR